MTEPQIRPANGPLWVVRWLRLDGRNVKHRYFRRRHDAVRFLTRLNEGGWTAELHLTSTRWERQA